VSGDTVTTSVCMMSLTAIIVVLPSEPYEGVFVGR